MQTSTTSTLTIIISAITVAIASVLAACTVDVEHTHPTQVPQATATPAPTITPVAIPSPLPTATPVAIPTALPTATPIVVRFPTPLPTSTPLAIPSPLPTSTPAPTATPVRLRYPTPLPTSTPAPTATPFVIRFPTPLPTATPQPTATPVLREADLFPDAEQWLETGIVAIETNYRPQYPNERGTAWAARDSHGNICLVTALHVAAKYTETSNGHEIPVSKPSRIISNPGGHRNNEFRWRSAAPVDDFVLLGPEERQITLPAWELAPPNARINAGDPIMVMAYDFIMDLAGAPYATRGIVSRPPVFGRNLEESSTIWFDAPVADGSSGGVLLNANLQVIGMVIGTEGPGRNVAVHISEIRESLQQPILRCNLSN